MAAGKAAATRTSASRRGAHSRRVPVPRVGAPRHVALPRGQAPRVNPRDKRPTGTSLVAGSNGARPATGRLRMAGAAPARAPNRGCGCAPPGACTAPIGTETRARNRFGLTAVRRGLVGNATVPSAFIRGHRRSFAFPLALSVRAADARSG